MLTDLVAKLKKEENPSIVRLVAERVLDYPTVIDSDLKAEVYKDDEVSLKLVTDNIVDILARYSMQELDLILTSKSFSSL